MTAQELFKRPAAEILAEIERGGRFVFYQYVISIVVLTFRRSSQLEFVPAGKSVALHGMRWTLLTGLLGWWGIPFGLIYTPMAIYRNLSGGNDVMAKVLEKLRPQGRAISFDKAEPITGAPERQA